MLASYLDLLQAFEVKALVLRVCDDISYRAAQIIALIVAQLSWNIYRKTL